MARLRALGPGPRRAVALLVAAPWIAWALVRGLARVAAVTAIVAVVGGLGTWLVGPAGTVHIGASGLVFGFASYLLVRGFFSRRPLHLIVGVAVLLVYGTTLLFGFVPTPGVSWQGHLFGAVGGVLAARVLHARRDRPVALTR